MKRQAVLIVGVGLLVLLTGLVPGDVRACGFCFSLAGNALALPHPKAIEIALATRAALDRGHLKEKPLVPAALWQGEGTGWTALDKIPPTQLVKAWAATAAVSVKETGALSIHFLFIDTEQCCEVLLRKGAVFFEAKPGAHCDARLVTTRAAFHALVSGEISVREAERLGIVRLEGDTGWARFFGKSASRGSGVIW